MNEPTLLKINPPIIICGDIRGSYFDLLNIFQKGGSPSNNKYLFLWSYTCALKHDYDHSIETICLLFAYKIKYKNNIFLL